jgi:hypothetical protein
MVVGGDGGARRTEVHYTTPAYALYLRFAAAMCPFSYLKP